MRIERENEYSRNKSGYKRGKWKQQIHINQAVTKKWRKIIAKSGQGRKK